jgi:hypothetical protein
MAYAVSADDRSFYLTVDGRLLPENRGWDGYTPEIGEAVVVTGRVEEATDLRGELYRTVEVASLRAAS